MPLLLLLLPCLQAQGRGPTGHVAALPSWLTPLRGTLNGRWRDEGMMMVATLSLPGTLSLLGLRWGRQLVPHQDFHSPTRDDNHRPFRLCGYGGRGWCCG